MLRSSTLSLCRKVLIYRDIDIPFAVASLSALSYDTMVKELKAAVPSIQSDFSRLQVVAQVGEELSHLWDQESLLLLFQGLQTNAKWWNILSSLGMKVDLRHFQHPDASVRDAFMKSLVPDLFARGGMDLEAVTEYCRQFDLEPEVASLAHIEHVLLKSPMIAAHDLSWISKVRATAQHLEHKATLTKLKELFPKLHPLDYEKIRYLCTWISDLLASDEEVENIQPMDADHHHHAAAAVENSPCSESGSHRSDRSISSSGRSSLQTKALKVPIKSSALLSANTDMDSRSSSEIDEYKRYFDIATYLSSLKFPRVATDEIMRSIISISKPVSSSSSSLHDDYDHLMMMMLSDLYKERLPFWHLLRDPWSVLDPILTHAPEYAAKLSPLCIPLKIDKNEFNARKIKAIYTRATSNLMSCSTPCSGNGGFSVYDRERKAEAIQAASDAMDLSISSPHEQVELWRWVFDKERGSGDDEHALIALDKAIGMAHKHAQVVVSKSVVHHHHPPHHHHHPSSSTALMDSLLQERRILNCERLVKSLIDELALEGPHLKTLLLSSVSNPSLLLRYILEIVVELSWDVYMQGLSQISSCITEFTLISCPPNHAVLQLVQKAARVIDEIAENYGLNAPLQANTTTHDSSSSANSLLTTQLEILRHSIIGRLLSDVETSSSSSGGGNSSSRSTGGASGSGLDADSTSMGTSSTGSALGFNLNGLWKFSEESPYLPGGAEKRRREDLYLSLSIAVLVLSCSHANQRCVCTAMCVV